MGIIDFFLAIRENLEQKETSTTLAPEVPGYKYLQMLDSQMVNYIDTFSNKTHNWSLQKGIPGFGGEKGNPGSSGLKVKLSLKWQFSSVLHLFFIQMYSCHRFYIHVPFIKPTSFISSPVQGLPGDTGTLGPTGPPGLKVSILKWWDPFTAHTWKQTGLLYLV